MPRFIEIGFVPLLKSAYPEDTLLIDTRLSWKDGRGLHASERTAKVNLFRIFQELKDAFSLPKGSGIDAVVVRARGSENSHSLGSGYALKKSLGLLLQQAAIRLATKHHCKLAVVDRRDEASIHANDRRIFEKCDLYFKRELPWSTWSLFEQIIPQRICIGTASHAKHYQHLEKKIRHLSLGIEDELISPGPLPIGSHSHDVFFTGTAYSLDRRLLIQKEMEVLSSKGIRVYSPERNLSRDEFLKTIRDSRLAISPGGVGWDCYRHYEIPAQGSALLLERPCHQFINAPINGAEAILYDPAQPVAPLIQRWLREENALQGIAQSGHKWVQANHTYFALGKRIAHELSTGIMKERQR